MCDNPLIPVYLRGEIIATVRFEPNLNLAGVPDYLNQSGNLGLARIQKGIYKGKLVLMYQNEFYPTSNRGNLINDNKAYELCVNRGKYDVIDKLGIRPSY